jgi:tRNA A37 threonylcarbamoyltransferase TsaD
MVGLVTAKALAMASGKPLLAINHLEGHALSPRLADADLAYPYLLLLVSGGIANCCGSMAWAITPALPLRSTMPGRGF